MNPKRSSLQDKSINNEALYKWYIVLVSDKKKELIIRQLEELIKDAKLEKYIKEIKLPNNIEMQQNEENDKVSFVSSATNRGIILLNILVNYDPVSKSYQIPEEVKLELNKLKLKFLAFNRNNAVPLTDVEFSQMFVKTSETPKEVQKAAKSIEFKIGDKVFVSGTVFNRSQGVISKKFLKGKRYFYVIQTDLFNKIIDLTLEGRYLTYKLE